MSNTRPTQKLGHVFLTFEQWNDLLLALIEARDWNEEKEYHHSAREIGRLQETINKQIGPEIQTAFDTEFPIPQTA